MENNILETLKLEHERVTKQLEALNTLISTYGGELAHATTSAKEAKVGRKSKKDILSLVKVGSPFTVPELTKQTRYSKARLLTRVKKWMAEGHVRVRKAGFKRRATLYERVQ